MRTLTVLHRTAAALLVVGVVALAAISVAQSDVTKVSALRLEKQGAASKYTIEQTGNADYQEFLLSNPRRLVIDVVGAQDGLEKHSHAGDGKLVTAVRTSQFTNDPNDVTRVVFDLADNTRYQVGKQGSSIVISFFADPSGKASPAPPQASEAKAMEAGFGSAWDTDAPVKTEAQQPETKKAPAPAAQPAPQETTVWNTTTAEPKQTGNSQWTDRPVTEVSAGDNKVQMAEPNPWASDTSPALRTRSYPAELAGYSAIGGKDMANKNISMDVQGADIKTVLRSISEFSGANIIAGAGVEGPIVVHLVEVPWREALDVILKANGYGLRIENGIYRVQKLDVLHNEEVDIALTAQKKEDLMPLESKVIELSFTNAKEMQQAMTKVTSKRGSIEVEKGTNAVIINDVPHIVDRIAAMILSLDRRVAQVEIVAKMVDVDVEATRELGVRWDFMNIMSTDINANADAFSGQMLTDPFSGLSIGTVQSWGDVLATIEALEKENRANIISNPRITTADNKEAFILVGKEIPLIVADEAGNPITELKKTGITLRVTPHVNSDGTITMDLHPEISDLAAQATVQGGIIISLSEANTRVLVKDGETAVIGGLITEAETKVENGVPVVKDLPILGNLFKYSSTTKKERELVIFVTPRIVDQGDVSMNQ